MTTLNSLTELQKSHLAWRLDAKTACGYVTACKIARGELGDLGLVDVFVKYGNITERSAKIHAGKVARFEVVTS